ncbi:MAG: PilN domain-containing protein [Phycisphaerales bacterium]|nr:PilN domain-containing protein [Phycisphaerales bacterium]
MIPARDHVRTVCALHRQLGSGGPAPASGSSVWQAVIATIGGSGAGSPGPGGVGGGSTSGIEIKAVQTIPESGAAAAIAALLEQHRVDLVIRVLPGSCSIARVTVLPETGDGPNGSSPAQIADALSLLGESELPTALPSYRRSAGLVFPGRGASRRPIGLLTGWPSTGAVEPIPGQRLAEIFVAEPAALAALAQLVGGVERAWSVDGPSISVVCVGAEKTVVRVSRCTGSDLDAAATRVVQESSRAAGIETHGVSVRAHAGETLDLHPWPNSPRIAGQARDERWLRSFGIAAGALAVYADPSPTVHGLANLHEVAPQLKPPILVRISRAFGRPMVAAILLGLCAIIAIGLPISVSYARVKMLEKQVTDEKSLMTRNAADERDLAFYRLLGEKRWPMTKLLADIAGACPVGVSLDAIELGVGEQVVLRGNAENSGLITTFRENLGKTRIFGDVATPSTTPGTDGVSFTMNAKIAPGAARFPAKPVDDFAAKPLVERIHGDSARSTGKRTTATGSRRDRTSGTAASRNSPSTTSRSPTVSTTPPREAPVIPPPLTDAQIAKLSGADAMKEWGARRKASTQSGVDEATRKRLAEEAEKARARMQEANRAASGGGGGL